MTFFSEYNVNILEFKTDWLKTQTKFKADESKRPGKPKNYSDIFLHGRIISSIKCGLTDFLSFPIIFICTFKNNR